MPVCRIATIDSLFCCVRSRAAPSRGTGRSRGCSRCPGLALPGGAELRHRRPGPLGRGRSGSSAGDLRCWGRLRAPPGPGRQRLQHQGQRAGSRERRGRAELLGAPARG